MITPEEKRKRHADYMREYYRRNRDKGRAQALKYARSHKKEAVERVRQWRLKNKERWLAQLRERYARNVEKKRKYNRGLYAKHAEKIRSRARANRTPERAAYEQAWQKRKFETDQNFRIKTYLKRNIRNSLFRHGKPRKATSTTKLLGCTIEFLRGYLEARFLPEMSWENYGKWHIDHFIPCAEFDLRDHNQQRQCFHYSNLRPLWAFDNISKKDKRPPTHQAQLL